MQAQQCCYVVAKWGTLKHFTLLHTHTCLQYIHVCRVSSNIMDLSVYVHSGH